MARPKKITTETATVKAPRKTTAKTKTTKTVRKSSTKKTTDFDSLTESSRFNSTVILSRIKKLPAVVNKNRRVVIPVVILLILAGLVFLAQKYLVVAWVDNKPITVFQYYSAMDSQYGKQTSSQLIQEQLILSEAAKRGVTASAQEVDAQVKTYQDQSQGVENFNQALAAQGLTLDSLKKQIKLQLLVQKMFGANIVISDADVNQYITDHKDQMPADITDSIKGSIKEQLQQQKLVDAFQAWLADAEKSSRVRK